VIEVSGVHVYEPLLSMLEAMTVPAMRLLEGPLRSINVTVPDVVGFQVRSVGEPAVTEYPPLGTLKGFAALCAYARIGAARSIKERVNNILTT